MHVSMNELKAALRRCFEAANYFVGNYEDAANMILWLEKHGLNGLQELQRTLPYIKQDRMKDMSTVIYEDSTSAIIDSHGRIKLIDFGSSQIGAVDEGTGLGLGTLNYSAPELFYGQENSHKSELFSLAVLTYQLLTNRLPYKELNQINDAPKQYNLWRYKAVTTYRKDLPRYIDVVLAKGLSADPNQRYVHYSEFISALNSSDMSIQTQSSLPLIERDPVKFWQGVSAVLFVLLLAVLFNS
jgi:serine/threonine protein kinase